MKFPRLVAFAITVFFAASLRADVTVRYKNNLKLGTGAPPVFAQQAAGVMKSAVSAETVIQIKGTNGYTSNGRVITLMDFATQVMTVVDPEHKQFATLYMKDYADQVLSILPAPSASPPEGVRKTFDPMNTTFGYDKTGKIATILGIQAEETILTLTVYLPGPNTPPTPASTGPPPPVFMRMVLHVWTVLPSEVERIPALREFSGVYGDPSARDVLNPDAVLEKTFSTLPGMSKGFIDMIDELSQKKGIMLRTNIEVFMPFMAQQLRSAPAATGQAPFDPEAPMLEGNMEVEQISTAPIDNSVFEVPPDCQLTSVPDLLRALLPAATQSAAAATPSSNQ